MSTIKVAIATNSLGKSAADHTIHRKLEVAKAYGFDGIEVAVECVDAHANTFSSLETCQDRLRAAASHIFNKASSLSLSLVALNSFGAYDGLVEAQDVVERLIEADVWCQLCRIMHIPIFQVWYPLPKMYCLLKIFRFVRPFTLSKSPKSLPILK